MAKIRVKLRLSRIPDKAGTVFYQLSHQKKVKQITTRLHLLPTEWDEVQERVREDAMQANPHLSAIQRLIDSDIAAIHQIIQSYDLQRKPFSLQQVIDAFRSSQEGSKILSYMHRLVEELSARGNQGTARNYRCTLSSFACFLEEKDIPFSQLNEPLILEYAEWLKKRGLRRNSSSFYMRNLRSMYNKAVSQQGLRQTRPFENVYTGIDKTTKRAADENVMARLLQLDLSHRACLVFARDIFVFSYCTRGMAFVDIAYLCKSNIKDGYICYTRRKTGKQLLVRIEKRVQKIIDCYAERVQDTPYVFPIIRAEDSRKAYSQYQTGLRYYNKHLKEIAKLLGDGVILSSYTPRHTWASIARSHNIPVSVISEGMGHASEKTTLIYLASLDNSVLDNANSKIVDLLEQWEMKEDIAGDQE